MRFKSVIYLTLFVGTAAGFGESVPDSPMTQNLLVEIRQLRQDLQATAATVQRVQILMYRIQTQASLVDRTDQRFENARSRCDALPSQRKWVANEIEQTETRLRNSQNPSERKAAEETLQRFKHSVEMFATEEQQCQIERADAETQFRVEHAKMNDLQDQLDSLDKVLAAYGRK